MYIHTYIQEAQRRLGLSAQTFSLQNPTGFYNLNLTSPADRDVALRLRGLKLDQVCACMYGHCVFTIHVSRYADMYIHVDIYLHVDVHTYMCMYGIYLHMYRYVCTYVQEGVEQRLADYHAPPRKGGVRDRVDRVWRNAVLVSHYLSMWRNAVHVTGTQQPVHTYVHTYLYTYTYIHTYMYTGARDGHAAARGVFARLERTKDGPPPPRLCRNHSRRLLDAARAPAQGGGAQAPPAAHRRAPPRARGAGGELASAARVPGAQLRHVRAGVPALAGGAGGAGAHGGVCQGVRAGR